MPYADPRRKNGNETPYRPHGKYCNRIGLYKFSNIRSYTLPNLRRAKSIIISAVPSSPRTDEFTQRW